MRSEISFKRFTRPELNENPELVKKYAFISRQEVIESDHPLPAPNIEWYENFYSLKPFPYEEQNIVLVENGERIVGYGITRSNEKFNSEMAFIFVYLIPEYRGQNLLWPIVEKLTESIPARIKKFNLAIRSDENAPRYDYRKKMIERLQSEFGDITFKARRSTTNLTKFKKEEVVKKAQLLKKQAEEKGYSLIFILDRPDFEKLPFSEQEYLFFLESIDNDMPRENGSFQDITLTPEMFYYRYYALEPLKRTRWHYIAVDNKSGKPAGMTEVMINKNKPDVVYQGDTGVYYTYRGNKLGLTLKYLMLAKILSNELTEKSTYWTTFNAKSNKHMIDINDELGYKEDAMWFQFEVEKEKLFELVKEKTS